MSEEMRRDFLGKMVGALAGIGLATGGTSTAEASTQGDKGVTPLVRPVGRV
jgi:hypothetical protein